MIIKKIYRYLGLCWYLKKCFAKKKIKYEEGMRPFYPQWLLTQLSITSSKSIKATEQWTSLWCLYC